MVDGGAAAVLDYDDERVLTLDDGTLSVLDRATGAESHGGRVDWRRRAVLVPGGVLASVDGRLVLTGPDGQVLWEKQQVSAGDPEFALAAVDLDAGVVVAALGPKLNTGPPAWLAAHHLPVIKVGGYPPGTAAEPATWSLVSAATVDVAAEVVAGGGAGVPVAAGDVALQSQVPACADLAIIGGPEVRWPAAPPAGECELVWLLDPERAVLTAWEDPNMTHGDR